MDYVFEWRGDAKSVFVCCSQDAWSKKQPLEKKTSLTHFSHSITPHSDSPETVWEFSCRIPAKDLQYKFIIDGVWQFDPKKPTIRDSEGNVNNILLGSFVLGATIAHELDGKTFSTADGWILSFSKFPGFCEQQYPWHGEWELHSLEPNSDVQRGKWSLLLCGKKRRVKFDSKLYCCESAFASFDCFTLQLSFKGPMEMTFKRSV